MWLNSIVVHASSFIIVFVSKKWGPYLISKEAELCRRVTTLIRWRLHLLLEESLSSFKIVWKISLNRPGAWTSENFSFSSGSYKFFPRPLHHAWPKTCTIDGQECRMLSPWILFTLGNVDQDIGQHSGRHSSRYNGRQSVDRRSTVGRQSVDSRSIVSRQSVDSRSIVR